MKRKLYLSLLALLLIFAVAGCGTENSESAGGLGSASSKPDTVESQIRSEAPQSSSQTTEPDNSLPQGGQPVQSEYKTGITADRAKEIALSHAGAAADKITGYEIEMDRFEAVPHFEIEFNFGGAEYDYEINAETGEIIKAERNDINLLPEKEPQTFISEQRAKEIAFSHAGIAADKVTEFELEFDKDDAVPHFEIEWKTGGFEYSYDINAETGVIIKAEKEVD